MALSNTGTGPKFIFGGRDASKFLGSLTYTKLAKNAVRILRGVPCLCLTRTQIQIFWEIALDSVKVNGKDIKITIKEAVIDSASTVIEGDSTDIANLYSNIPGSAPDPTLPGRYTSTLVAVSLLEWLTNLRENDSPVQHDRARILYIQRQGLHSHPAYFQPRSCRLHRDPLPGWFLRRAGGSSGE
jgi:hypothetical protein